MRARLVVLAGLVSMVAGVWRSLGDGAGLVAAGVVLVAVGLVAIDVKQAPKPEE